VNILNPFCLLLLLLQELTASSPLRSSDVDLVLPHLVVLRKNTCKSDYGSYFFAFHLNAANNIYNLQLASYFVVGLFASLPLEVKLSLSLVN
jgi:hypothetical protein